jgi:hypothetical protein
MEGDRSLYEDPRSSTGWQDVASERATDTVALEAVARHVAALYMLGYVVECYAKALCHDAGRPVPRGRDGHDLVAILDRSGVRRTDLPVDLREFADTRDVSLRYQATVPGGIDPQEQLRRGRQLARWCRVRLNRSTRRKR